MINKKLIFKSIIFPISLLTFSLPKNTKAATWAQVTENLNQNAEQINNCLAIVSGEYKKKEPKPSAIVNREPDALAIIEEKLEKTHHCLNPLFHDFLEHTEVKLNFQNTIFTEKVSLMGEFTFKLSDLEKNLISQNDLTSFSLKNNLCESSNLSSFSYVFSEQDKMNFELQYTSNILAKIREQNPNNQQIVSLQNSLDSLTTKDEIMMMAERVLLGESLFTHPSIELLSSYITPLQDSSPQLQIECESEKGKLSVKNGISNLTFIQQKDSQNSGISFNVGSSTETITVNEQSLTIKTRSHNQKIETTYQGLPLSVSGRVNLVLPKNEV